MKVRKGELLALHRLVGDKMIPDMSTEGFVSMMRNLAKTAEIESETTRSIERSGKLLVTEEVKEAQRKLSLHQEALSKKEEGKKEDLLDMSDFLSQMKIFNEYKEKENAALLKLSDQEVEIDLEQISMSDFDIYRAWKDENGKGMSSADLSIIFKFLVSV